MGARSAGGTENHTWRVPGPGRGPGTAGEVTARQRLRRRGGRRRWVDLGAATLLAMTSRSRAGLPVLLALALALTACGGGDDAAAPTTSAASTSSAGPSASPASATPDGTDADGAGDGSGDTGDDGDADAGPFPANTDPDTGQASSDALVTVTDIRLGRHDGFDRVVFETDGTGTPGWDVRYVDAAASQGSGDPIEVEGGAVLQVTLTGVGLPGDTGVEEYSGPRRLSAADTEVVTEVVWDATFEGTSVAFTGVTEETPFRVYLLEDPARVVLEVADPG